MILQSLYQDAEEIIQQVYGPDMSLPPPMYNYQPLAAYIEIDPTTGVASFQQLAQGNRKQREKPRADCLPYLGRTSAVAAIALVDKPAYVLGIEDGKAAASGVLNKRNADTQKAFRELVQKCFNETHLAELEPVLRFLSDWTPAHPAFAIPLELKSNDLIGFRLRGTERFLHEYEAVQEFWANYTRGADVRRLTCLVTTQEADIETKLPLGIKGVPGGQSSGAALSSFNSNAFMSYGLDAYSAPISRDAGERFGKALNALLASKDHSTVIGPFDSGVAFVYWSPATTVPLLTLADEVTPEELAELYALVKQQPPPDQSIIGKVIRAAQTGERTHTLTSEQREAPFHILGLSSHSGGRVAIRSALTLSLSDLFARQIRWFERLQMVNMQGQPGKPLGIPQLIRSAYRDRKEIPNRFIEAMVQLSLAAPSLADEGHPDAPVLFSLLSAVIQRCNIGTVVQSGGKERREHVTYPRAALIKFLLTWNNEEKAKQMSDLDTDNDDAAYRCGRLLYHLERIQYLALGKVNATLVDRYYGGASTTPQSVFPHLLRNANQAHLPTVRRERGAGRFLRLQDEMAEILEPLGTNFPRFLSLKQQGAFALGYYHQRAKVAHEIAMASERKMLAQATETDSALAEEGAMIEGGGGEE